MMENENQYMIGKVEDYAKRKGWFFGAFMDHPLLRSDRVEVGWQTLTNVVPEPSQKHLHKETVEINVLISGWMSLVINGQEHHLEKGQFYIVWPYSVVENIRTGEHTELLVVRAPSKPSDKYPA